VFLCCACIVQPSCVPITTLNNIPHLTKSETDEKNKKKLLKFMEPKSILP